MERTINSAADGDRPREQTGDRMRRPPTIKNPLLDHLGIELLDMEPERATFRLSIEPRHLNLQGKLQGGTIATLLDAACGYSVLLDSDGERTFSAVTVMLNVAYSAGISEGLVFAQGRVTGGGRRIVLTTGEVQSESGVLIASAQGVFRRVSSSNV